MATAEATLPTGSRISDSAEQATPGITSILLIRLKSIGDVAFTLPAFHAVRARFPAARIAFLTRQENRSLLDGFRGVDSVIALDRSLYRPGQVRGMIRQTLALLARLRRERFSMVMDFQGFGETALLTRWTGAPRRWGTVYGPGRSWAYTRAVERNTLIHPAANNLALLDQCGIPASPVRNEFALPQAALDEATLLFAERGLNSAARTLFIQPFTSEPRKAWPLDRLLAVAAHWRREGVQVAFGGGPSDRAALDPAVQAGFPVFAGAPLLVSGGLMKLSTIILGSDTGMLHLAVAMNKRVVMFMADIVPGCPHPFGHPNWIVPAPDRRTIARIETGAVVEACMRAFAEAG